MGCTGGACHTAVFYFVWVTRQCILTETNPLEDTEELVHTMQSFHGM